MPHKGTRSTVSVAGVGLMPSRSGGDSGEDAWREEGTRLSASAQSQPARTKLEGVGSKPELPDEFLPRQDELTFKSLFLSDERLCQLRRSLYTYEKITLHETESSDRSVVQRNAFDVWLIYSYKIWFVPRCLLYQSCSQKYQLDIYCRSMVWMKSESLWEKQVRIIKKKGGRAVWQYALEINKLWMYGIRWQWNREAKQEVATPAAVGLAAPLTCCMRAVVIHHGRGLGTAPIGRFCGHVVW